MALSDRKRKEVSEFLKRRIAGVMEWYCNPRSEALDCPETRKNINKELDGIFPEAEKKFKLKKIPLVLRVRSTETPGILKVRAEKLTLV